MSKKVRISIDVDEDLKKQLSDILPWGTQNHVLRAVLVSLVKMCKNHGTDRVLGALLAGDFDLFEESKNGRFKQP